jgi:hypothetical protein
MTRRDDPERLIPLPGTTMPQTFSVGARSRFVTGVALATLLLSLVGLVAGVLEQATQVAWAATLAFAGEAGHGPLPPATRWLARELPWVIDVGVVLCAAMAVASLGVIQRLEWARRVFIAGLVATAVVALGGLWLQQEFMQLLADTAHRRAPLPAPAGDVLDGLLAAARWLGVGATAVATLLGVAVIRRLGSDAVRQEFA